MRGTPSESDQEKLRRFADRLDGEKCLYCGSEDVYDGNDLRLCVPCLVTELVEMAQIRDDEQVRKPSGVAFRPDVRLSAFKARKRAREVLDDVQ